MTHWLDDIRGIGRRRFVALVAASAFIAFGTAASATEDEEPYIDDDGLYHQSWFLESFLELRDDLDEATAEGKRFAIMWEQKGCPYCIETHLVNFADPDIRDFVRHNFTVVQLNLYGSRIVTDFDGEELEERDLARKYGVRFSPTIQFFPDVSDGIGTKAARDREIARMPGYLKPPHFLAMFRYVKDRGYQDGSFRSYLKRQRDEAS